MLIVKKYLKDPVVWLSALAFFLMGLHLLYQPDAFSRIGAEKIYKFELSMFFEPGADGVNVKTFLPQSNNRQEIIRETILSGNMAYSSNEAEIGREATWSGSDTKQIHYSAVLANTAVNYQIDDKLEIESEYPEEIADYLAPTEAIPTDHPEIIALWRSIRPANKRLIVPILHAIFDYTYIDIKGAPFKGFTDALTALRLKQASCNGKGRLFVALARLNGIPARLVGGVILNEGRKKTSHQWVEVYIQNNWVPFDPTNGHFTSIPEHYLQLYIGDESLFSHTRDINFDYYFSSQIERLSTVLLRPAPEDAPAPVIINAVQALAVSGMSEKSAGVFLLFPICTLIIAFLRNVVGVRTLGVFVPMLIAAACVYTGFFTGIGMFAGVLFFAFVGHWNLEKLNLLKVPRLAAIITVCTILIIGVIMLTDIRKPLELGMLSLFPIVIISFLAERIHEMAAEHDWGEMLSSGIGSLVSIFLCYASFTSLFLQGVFAAAPELLFLVLALQIHVGRWLGIRLIEYFRFWNIIGEGETLGINQRNLDFVNVKNSKALLELAIDKLRTKECLLKHNIPVPGTIDRCESQQGLNRFLDALSRQDSCVIKPNRGSKGNGILVLVGRDATGFVTAGGKSMSLESLRAHVTEILMGAYSQDGNEDQVYLEPLIMQHESLNSLSNLGLADIRIILSEGEIISAMLRLPTKDSDGKANLHQGAVGLNVDLSSGKSTAASFKGKPIDVHPDSGANLIDFRVRYWTEILDIARRCYAAVPLGYLGVDISIDHTKGPLVLEVNGRPGLEIQNVRKKGLRNDLAQANQEG